MLYCRLDATNDALGRWQATNCSADVRKTISAGIFGPRVLAPRQGCDGPHHLELGGAYLGNAALSRAHKPRTSRVRVWRATPVLVLRARTRCERVRARARPMLIWLCHFFQVAPQSGQNDGMQLAIEVVTGSYRARARIQARFPPHQIPGGRFAHLEAAQRTCMEHHNPQYRHISKNIVSLAFLAICIIFLDFDASGEFRHNCNTRYV